MDASVQGAGSQGDYPPPAAAGGREQALDICTSPLSLPSITPRQTAGRGTGDPVLRGEPFSREVVGKEAARRRRSSYTGVSLWTPLRPLPQWLAAPFRALHHRQLAPPGRW